MPFEYSWYVPDQVVYARIYGEQTLEELEDSNAQMLQYLNASERSLVHFIVNTVDLQTVPLSLAQTRKTLTYTKHPKLGWTVVIDAKDPSLKNYLKDFTITMLSKLARARYTQVQTLEEAIAHLSYADTTLNWDQRCQEAFYKKVE